MLWSGTRPRLIAPVLFSILFACSTPLAQEPQKVPIDLSQHLYLAATLGPGDVFEVRVYEEKDLSGKFRVAPDGSIDFPLVGKQYVEGKTPSDVAALLQSKLSDGFLKDPYVTIFVVKYNSKKVFVLGQVNKPGTYPLEEHMNIVQAVTAAGGFSRYADENGTIVTRIINGLETRYTVPVEKISRGTAKNFSIKPGDIVFVPESIL